MHTALLTCRSHCGKGSSMHVGWLTRRPSNTCKSTKKLVAVCAARDGQSITVVLEPPPSSAIALQAPAAAMRSAISATVAPAKSERRARTIAHTRGEHTAPVFSLSSPSTCSVIILPLASWPRAVRGAYEYELRGGNAECGFEGLASWWAAEDGRGWTVPLSTMTAEPLTALTTETEAK